MEFIKRKALIIFILIFNLIFIPLISFAESEIEWKKAYKNFLLDYNSRILESEARVLEGDFELKDTIKVSDSIWNAVDKIFEEKEESDEYIARFIDFENVYLLNIIDDTIPQLIIQSSIYQWYSEGWDYYEIYTYKDGNVIRLEEDKSKLDEENSDYYNLLFYKKSEDGLDKLLVREEYLGIDEIDFADIIWDDNILIAEKNNISDPQGYIDMSPDVDKFREKYFNLKYELEDGTEGILLSFPILEEEVDKILNDYIVENKEDEIEEINSTENIHIESIDENINNNNYDFIINLLIGILLILILVIGLVFYNKKRNR